MRYRFFFNFKKKSTFNEKSFLHEIILKIVSMSVQKKHVKKLFLENKYFL